MRPLGRLIGSLCVFFFASRKGVCIYSCFPRGRVPCSSSFFFFFFLRAEEKNQRKSTFLELFENTVFFVLPPYGNCRLGVSLFGVRGRAGRWKSSPPELKRGTVVKFHKSSTSKSTKIYIFWGGVKTPCFLWFPQLVTAD